MSPRKTVSPRKSRISSDETSQDYIKILFQQISTTIKILQESHSSIYLNCSPNIFKEISSILAEAEDAVNSFLSFTEDFQNHLQQLEQVHTILKYMTKISLAQEKLKQLSPDLELLPAALQKAATMRPDSGEANFEKNIETAKQYSKLFNDVNEWVTIDISSHIDMIGLELDLMRVTDYIQNNFGEETKTKIQNFIDREKEALKTIYSQPLFENQSTHVREELINKFILSEDFKLNKTQDDEIDFGEYTSELCLLKQDCQKEEGLILYPRFNQLEELQAKIQKRKNEIYQRIEEARRIEERKKLEERLNQHFEKVKNQLIAAHEEATHFFSDLPKEFYANETVHAVYFSVFSQGRVLFDLYNASFSKTEEQNFFAKLKEQFLTFGACKNEKKELADIEKNLQLFEQSIAETQQHIKQYQESITQELNVYEEMKRRRQQEAELLQKIEEMKSKLDREHEAAKNFFIKLPKEFCIKRKPQVKLSKLFFSTFSQGSALDDLLQSSFSETGEHSFYAEWNRQKEEYIVCVREKKELTDAENNLQLFEKSFADTQLKIKQHQNHIMRELAEYQEAERIRLLIQQAKDRNRIALTELLAQFLAEKSQFSSDVARLDAVLIQEFNNEKKSFDGLKKQFDENQEKIKTMQAHIAENEIAKAGVNRSQPIQTQLAVLQELTFSSFDGIFSFDELKKQTAVSPWSIRPELTKLQERVQTSFAGLDLSNISEHVDRIIESSFQGNVKQQGSAILQEKMTEIEKLNSELEQFSQNSTVHIASEKRSVSGVVDHQIGDRKQSISDGISNQNQLIKNLKQSVKDSAANLVVNKQDLQRNRQIELALISSDQLTRLQSQLTDTNQKITTATTKINTLNARKNGVQYVYYSSGRNEIQNKFDALVKDRYASYRKSLSLKERRANWLAKKIPKLFKKPSSKKQEYEARLSDYNNMKKRCDDVFTCFQNIMTGQDSYQVKIINLQKLQADLNLLIADLRRNYLYQPFLAVLELPSPVNKPHSKENHLHHVIETFINHLRTLDENEGNIGLLNQQIIAEESRITNAIDKKYDDAIADNDVKIAALNKLIVDCFPHSAAPVAMVTGSGYGHFSSSSSTNLSASFARVPSLSGSSNGNYNS